MHTESFRSLLACRAIAQRHKKAADEADALATEPRALRPHGVMQYDRLRAGLRSGPEWR